MKGPDGSYSGTLPRVLAMGGFKAKALIPSGTCDEEEVEALGGKFLGVPYDPRSDRLLLKLRTTIRARTQKRQKGKPTDFQSLDDDFVEEVLTGQQVLTRRKVLSLLMSQYDPLGSLAPLLVQAKLILRDLYGKGKEQQWDPPLPAEQARKWSNLIREAKRCPEIAFPH